MVSVYFSTSFIFLKNMRSMNLQFFLNILDILDIKVWSLKKKKVYVTLFLARVVTVTDRPTRPSVRLSRQIRLVSVT